MNYRCLLFDLDGTLVESRADLIHSVNLTLNELGRASLPENQVLGFVGEGARLLIERAVRAGFRRAPDAALIDQALEIFRRTYRRHLLDQTRPYPEVEATLRHFQHLPKAVVTNKPFDFSLALLAGLGLLSHFAVVLGGDSLPERKPAPQPLLEAARRCGVAPAQCLMIGDSRVDIEAGRKAGMKTCGHTAGFRGRAELVAAGADFLIESFGELRGVIEG